MGLYHKNRERKRKTFWLIDTGAPLCYHDFRRETAANSIADKVSLGQGEAFGRFPTGGIVRDPHPTWCG